MTIEEKIREQIEKNKGLKLAVGEINNHLSVLEGLLRKQNEDRQVDLNKTIDEAYQKGHKEGYAKGFGEGTFAVGDDYQKGLNDAWEAARKISLMPADEIEKVFPGAAKYNRYNLGYSGVEAIAKLKAYEEKQKADDEIKVGDEVICNERRFIVFATETEEHYASLFDVNGRHVSASQRECKKTGRHFDIESILEAMKK